MDDAIQELENSGDTFKGCVRIGLFTSINLEANVIKKVVDEVNKISHKTFGEEKDFIGRVYEYFLKSFAVNATKEEGEFYTPHDIVELIAAFIEPFDGTLYDPCCGSGVCVFKNDWTKQSIIKESTSGLIDITNLPT